MSLVHGFVPPFPCPIPPVAQGGLRCATSDCIAAIGKWGATAH